MSAIDNVVFGLEQIKKAVDSAIASRSKSSFFTATELSDPLKETNVLVAETKQKILQINANSAKYTL